jgi:hypothetical protein
MTRAKLRQIVARAAARQLPSLPPRERADLIEGIALLLSDVAAKDLARHTVGLIRQTEEHQRQLYAQLTASGAEAGAFPSGTLNAPKAGHRKVT